MEQQSINMQPIKTTPPSKKSKKAKVAIIVLAILLAGALGYGAYAWWQNDTLTQNASNKEQENNALKAENANLKEQSDKTAKERDALAQEPTPPSDEEAVTTAAKNFADAAVQDDTAVNEVSQVKINGNFADAVISMKGAQGGGYGVTLKKVNDAWVVIYNGQNAPDQETVRRFGIPQ